MLTTSEKILRKAQKGGYAVAAFNINNMEITQAVIDAAVIAKAPVILQTSEGALAYGGLNWLYALMREAAQAPVPVAIHLDHGKDYELIKECIAMGYTSVMFDGSSLAYADNVRQTKKVVAYAHKRGVSVEAELGALAGIEDFVTVEQRDAHLTDPDQVVDFVARTGCDALAIAIGTSHGLHKFTGEPELDFKRLKAIRAKVTTPLVLHGASEVDQRMVKIAKKYGAHLKNARGVTDALMKKAVKGGITKVNTDTDIRLAFDAGVREVIATKPDAYDPREILGKARDYMREVALERIIVLGSKNKA